MAVGSRSFILKPRGAGCGARLADVIRPIEIRHGMAMGCRQ
ncbi:hypothetical protein WH5701_14621 [Synechococcus sp. WH 5701]|nr:hypothetical protein WH5701_14621 [Synechococcus sp. WH 5701]